MCRQADGTGVQGQKEGRHEQRERRNRARDEQGDEFNVPEQPPISSC